MSTEAALGQGQSPGICLSSHRELVGSGKQALLPESSLPVVKTHWAFSVASLLGRDFLYATHSTYSSDWVFEDIHPSMHAVIQSRIYSFV